MAMETDKPHHLNGSQNITHSKRSKSPRTHTVSVYLYEVQNQTKLNNVLFKDTDVVRNETIAKL